MMPPLIELRGVEKRYGKAVVLKDVNLDIDRSEFLVVVGPSGSGKTTILRMIGGFMEPSAGEILLDGTSIAKVPVNRRPFNTVFQDYALFPHMTVAGNVEYGLRVKGVAAAEMRKQVSNALDLVSLSKFAGRYPAEMSGGQRQRVALARALVCRPRLVLLDEPLAALDASLRRQMQIFLKDVQRDVKTSFLFITHDQEEAISLADRICVMDHGEVVQVGSPREIYYHPRNNYVAEFFGNNNLIGATVTDRQDGMARVKTGFGPASVSCSAEGALEAGSTATLAVRPEAIRISAVQRPRSSARVTSIEFVGSISTITVQSNERPQDTLRVKALSRQASPPLSDGDFVAVEWDPSEAWVVPQ